MSIQLQPNENTPLVIKIWKDDEKLEDIVKEEYRKKGIDENTNRSRIQKLNDNDLFFLGDWKKFCTRFNAVDRGNTTNVGLVLLLDEVAGIEPENVSSRKN